MPLENKNTQWALVDENGNSVLDFTSLLSAEITDEGGVMSEPVEQGGFASYNKTNTPLAVRVELGAQGTPDELQDFLDKLTELKKGVKLFSLITPEQEYKNLTLESFRYSRKREDGLNSIYAELTIVEIAQVAPQYTNVQLPPAACRNPENASKADTGKAQTTQERPKTIARKIGDSARE